MQCAIRAILKYDPRVQTSEGKKPTPKETGRQDQPLNVIQDMRKDTDS